MTIFMVLLPRVSFWRLLVRSQEDFVLEENDWKIISFASTALHEHNCRLHALLIILVARISSY